MSSLEVGPEWVCYVHCNFCNTDLVVSVPCSSLLNVVTVGCGHCANLLYVNMKSLVQPNPLQLQNQNPNPNPSSEGSSKDHGSSSSSKCSKSSVLDTSESEEPPRMLPIRPPEKRQRVPSAYNRFIKEEIQRIKASNPDISHREAFSTAAKNWAHFPHIHFGLMMDGNKRVKVDEGIVGKGIEGEGTQKTQDFYYVGEGTQKTQDFYYVGEGTQKTQDFY